MSLDPKKKQPVVNIIKKKIIALASKDNMF